MKLYTDPGNLHSLKILISANLAGRKLQIEQTKTDAKAAPYLLRSSLPVLEVASDCYLHSANAASRFLVAAQDTEPLDGTQEDEWLEWEASQLQPVLHRYLTLVIGQKRDDRELKGCLDGLLAKMDQFLSSHQFLAGAAVRCSDICLWSSLLPVFGRTSLLKECRSEFGNIAHWFDSLHQQIAFQTAVLRVVPNGDIQNIKPWLVAHPAPPLPCVQTAAIFSKSAGGSDIAGVANSQHGISHSVLVTADKSVTAEEAEKAADNFCRGHSQVKVPVKTIHPILPKEGERNILITSALPYVNNVPHLGNIIGCVLSADVFARFCRLRQFNTLYICGTDEYGTATETKALEEGLTPQEICSKYNKLHTEIYQAFNIQFDYFGRTSTQQQTEIAQDIFWQLYNRGHILKDCIDQLHCQHCDRFLADRFVEGTCPFCVYEDARGDQCDKCGKLINAIELKEPRCKICHRKPTVRSTDHLFLDLPKLEPALQEHLDKVFQSGVWTPNSKVITKSWIRDGLKPRCISRDLKWGTQVPLEGYTDKVFYVWFDAPIGYISITANYTDQWQKWWKNPDQVELYNFLGKDNVPFHSVIFPCTLLGTGDSYTVVHHMSATEYLNYEDAKFSKSRGTGVFGNDVKDTGIPTDIWRFYLLFVRPESQDSCFSWDDFILKNNSELLNNLGNFINRALTFVQNFFESQIPEMTLEAEDKDLLVLVNRELCGYVDNLNKIKLRDGLRNILSISRHGNQYIQANKPWVLVKAGQTEKARAGTIIGVAANVCCLIAVLLQPFMPDVSATIQAQLNAPQQCNVVSDVFVSYLTAGHRIGTPKPLFQKIETSTIDALKKKFAGNQPSSKVVDEAEVQRLTDEVAKQGEVVRQLKALKPEKSVLDAEVSKLLQLKGELAKAQGSEGVQSSKKKGGQKGKQQQKKAESGKKAEVTKQPAGSDSSTAPIHNCSAADVAEVERLTIEVSKQGAVVRDLKANKAEKSQIDSEVARLLDLKKQLAICQGQDPSIVIGGGSKKKKNKKQ